MESDVQQMKSVIEWLRDGNTSQEGKSFASYNPDVHMKMKKQSSTAGGCIPIEEVKRLLSVCASELGIENEK